MQHNILETKPFTIATAKEILKQEALEGPILPEEEVPLSKHETRKLNCYLNEYVTDDQKRRMKTLRRLAARKMKDDAKKGILVTADDLC